eukprot:COSAG01_NODE_146_length_24099_cov_25.341208_11_plen_135_part_00
MENYWGGDRVLTHLQVPWKTIGVESKAPKAPKDPKGYESAPKGVESPQKPQKPQKCAKAPKAPKGRKLELGAREAAAQVAQLGRRPALPFWNTGPGRLTRGRLPAGLSLRGASLAAASCKSRDTVWLYGRRGHL